MPRFAFSEGQRRTLEALCDTVVRRFSDAEEQELLRTRTEADPAHLRAYCRSSGSDLGVPAAVEAAVAAHLPEDTQVQLSMLLTAMSSRLGMFLLFGTWAPFGSLSVAEREQCLRKLQSSVFSAKRKAFVSIKALIGGKAFSRDTAATNPQNSGQARNSVWAAMGYAGPASASEAAAAAAAAGRDEFRYTMLNASISADAELEADVVVVGSGCGGSVVAAELAQAGHRVLVLEKGTHVFRAQLTGVEADGFERLYERGGLLTTEDSGIAVLAGAAFGGGTAVNWACCLRTPEHVKQEWARDYGLRDFVDGKFDDALDAVCARIGVTSEGVAHSRCNELLLEGCRSCGYPVGVAPQNMADVGALAPGAGCIGVGDRYGIKQSTPETFLRDAATAQTPAQFADRCFVERVMHEQGRVTGLRARLVGSDGATEHALTVRAPVVVVSCGSINSPALLLRSGLPNRSRQIGRNLRLHPVTGVVGFVADGEPDVAIWTGAPMTTVSTAAAAGPAGDHYGALLECPSALPGIAASLVPWSSGHEYKDNMLDYNRMLCTVVLTRDKGSGEVRLDKSGAPRLYYQLGDHDRQSMADGLEKAIRIAAAAGVARIASGHFTRPRPLPPPSQPEARAAALETILAEVRSVGFPAFKVPLFSAHQMGTCRMGSDPKTSVVKPTCEAWECSGLYVVDASTFPTSSGVNPMVTTLAVAHLAAQGLKASLAGPRGRPARRAAAASGRPPTRQLPSRL